MVTSSATPPGSLPGPLTPPALAPPSGTWAAMDDDRRGAMAAAMVCLGGMALSLVFAIHFHHVCDDAFISYRYAQNFVQGNGLVFNPGERVMGYSDLLWVLMIAGMYVIHIEPPLSGEILGTLFAWLTLVMVARYVWRKHHHVLAVAGALAFMVANATFAIWMFAGLEGHLFTALVAYAVIKTLDMQPDEPWTSWALVGLFLGLASITRPEGLMYAGPVCGFFVLRRGWAGLRPAIVVGVVATAIFAAAAVWQMSYYGSPVPNTYYAKNLPLSIALLYRGLGYTHAFLRAYNYLPVFVVGAWTVSRSVNRRADGWLALGVIAGLAAFYMRIGGDSLVFYRMWLVTLPMFALLVGDLVAGWEPWSTPAVAIPLAVALLSLPEGLVGGDMAYLKNDDLTLMNLRVIGRKLHELPKDTHLAANTVGILAFYSQLPLVDMLGLNDAHIARLNNKYMYIPAHESHDGQYVLDREPDIIIPIFPWLAGGPSTLEDVLAHPKYQSDRDLYASPRLTEEYRLEELKVGHRGYLTTFVKNGYAKRHDLAGLLASVR